MDVQSMAARKPRSDDAIDFCRVPGGETLFLYGVLVILTVQLLTGRINMDFSVGRTRAGRNPSVPRASSYWC